MCKFLELGNVCFLENLEKPDRYAIPRSGISCRSNTKKKVVIYRASEQRFIRQTWRRPETKKYHH